MPLQDLIGLCQTDSTPVFLGGVVQLENLVVDFLGNTIALIPDLGNHYLPVRAPRDLEISTAGHGLYPVQDHVEDGLLHEVTVDLHRQRTGRQFGHDLDSVLFGLRSGQRHDILEQATQVHFFQAQIPRAGKVHQDLHHPVQAVNLAVDDVHVPAGVWVHLLQFVLQQPQVQHDRVNGILDLVGDAAREASAGRHAARHLDFIFDLPHRLGVAQDQQGADLAAPFLDKVQRDLHTLAVRGLDLFLCHRTAQVKTLEQQHAQRGIAGEDLIHGSAKQLAPRAAQEALHRGANQHYARLAGEQHQAVLQIPHDLVDVVLQGRENLLGIPYLATQVRNLQGDQTVFVATGYMFPHGFTAAGGNAVQGAADPLERPESQVGQGGGEHQREEDGSGGKNNRVLEGRRNFVLEEYGRNAHPNRSEQGAVEIQGYAHVINTRGVVHQPQLLAELGGFDALKAGTVGNHLADQVGIGMQNCFPVGVDNGRVINVGPAAHDGFQEIVQRPVGSQVVGQGLAHGIGVVRVDPRAAEVGGFVGRQEGEVGGQMLGAVGGAVDTLAQEFGDINVGKCRHQHRHHEGNGEHDFGSQAHSQLNSRVRIPKRRATVLPSPGTRRRPRCRIPSVCCAVS